MATTEKKKKPEGKADAKGASSSASNPSSASSASNPTGGPQSSSRPQGTLHRNDRKLPRRRFVSDMPDRGLFIIIAMMGFASIFAMKLLKYEAEMVAVWAVVLMLFYGVVAFRIPDVRLRTDRLGDNFYYLGFIYTLASLSAALVEIRGGVPIDESLLGSFGIALLTTIVGIAGRVMFVQMRSELDEIETATRRDLLEMSRDLRTQLGVSLRDFQAFHTGVQQASREIAEESANAVRVQISEISNAAKTAASAIQETLAASQSQHHAMNEQMVALGKEVEALLTRLRDLTESMGMAPRKRSLWSRIFRRKQRPGV